jgi:hypothetical protein
MQHRVFTGRVNSSVILVLDAFPEPLDEDVIAPAAFAIHDDFDHVVLE